MRFRLKRRARSPIAVGNATNNERRTPSPFRSWSSWCGAFTATCLVLMFQWVVGVRHRIYPSSESKNSLRKETSRSEDALIRGPCAINLYGLPRSFKNLVLPSIIENVVRPNMQYRCDYFVHYFHRTYEPPGRDGRGGTINPDEILQLKSAIMEASDYSPIMAISRTTEHEFLKEYRDLLEQLHNATDTDGNLLFMPINHPSYNYDTVDNVMKMFHGQLSVWNLMIDTRRSHASEARHFSRVAMLRNDVFYATPIDIYELPDRSVDYSNEYAVVPGFSLHPVNDRLIYGPYDAVKIWAASRFDRIWKHIELVQNEHFGDGIHSERFLAFTIFPAIRDAGIPIQVDNSMCFLRVRSDESIRLDDCQIQQGRIDETQRAVESILNKPCQLNRTISSIVHLECG